MTDNYLERHREEYERKKAAWLRKQRHQPPLKSQIEKPDDEAL